MKQTGDSHSLKRVLLVMELALAGKFPSLAEQAFALAKAFRDRDSLLLPVYLPPLEADATIPYEAEGLAVAALDLSRFRLSELRQLLRLIRRNRIEVVHWNFYHPISNPYLWALTLLAPGVEHYYTDHISRPAEGRTPGARQGWVITLKNLLARRYARTLCISAFVQAQLAQMGWPRTELLLNFINVARFCPAPEVRTRVRRQLGVEDEFVCLVAAYLIRDKGVDVAVRALGELPESVVLWVAGDGPERSSLERLAEDLGVAHRIRLLGSQRDVAPFMQSADCLVCPSLWREGAGNVNFEGMACGLPDVASRTGGIPEFVQDGLNGFLFQPGDHQELARQVRRLVEDPAMHRRMGEAARAQVVELYSTEHLIEQHLQVHQK